MRDRHSVADEDAMTKQTEVVQLHKHRKVKNGEVRFLEIGTFDGPSGAKIYWRQIVSIPAFTGWFYSRSSMTAKGSEHSVWGPFETREKAEADAHRTAPG
jgi:hypothetical protein